MSLLFRLPLMVALGAAVWLTGCERPPVDSVQTGYRGTGMVQVYNPRTVEKQIPLNQPPGTPPVPAAPDGPRAKDVLQNVQVLGDLGVAEFTGLMTAITAWVSPTEGCAYCHNLQNLADDSKYTKIVARRMLQMTRHVNADWKNHVAGTGVTCWTCHRGKPVPAYAWTMAPPQNKRADFIGNLNGQNQAAKTVGLASLPYDPFTPYLLKGETIKIGSDTALPTGQEATIQATEGTYALMMHLSSGLGVNCTYCHNTRALGTWDQSSPKRVTAWHGLRMVADLNVRYVEPLTKTLPPDKLGPAGDIPKVNCATCHQGAYKPVYGAQMAKDYPSLLGPGEAPKAVADGPALPAPVAEALRSVLYFGVGSPALEAPQAEGLKTVVASLKAQPAAKATISGFHSAAGTLAQNQELAKQRAFGVRDALVAAGVDAGRIALAKPQQTSANVGGEDPTARRVEVTVR
jgi:photosynthetic reaction center cytochrome c subunit